MDCVYNIELLPDIGEITDKPDWRCPVDWALNVADIARMNNCGESVMCRDGMQQLYTIIHDITAGRGQPEDIELLMDICGVISHSQGCDLAARSSELIIKSLDLYGEEWSGHIRRKRCAALICKSYYTVHVLPGKCTGCCDCIAACGAGAILGGDGLVPVIDADRCTRCDACLSACPAGTIVKAGAIKPKTPDAPVPVLSLTPDDDGGNMRRRKRKTSE